MKLTAVKAELHIFDENVNWAEPIRIAFEFEGNVTLRLRGASDGQRLFVDSLPLELPTDLEEYGRTEIFDFADRLGLVSGEEIGEPNAIRIPTGQLVGLALPRFGHGQLCIWINGDGFHWGSGDDLNVDYWPEGFAPVVGANFKPSDEERL